MSIRSLSIFSILSLTFLLAGCGTSLGIQPDSGATIKAPQNPADVPIQLTWPDGSLTQGPVVNVDALPVPALAVTNTGAKTTVQLPAGPHTVRVQLSEKCWY